MSDGDAKHMLLKARLVALCDAEADALGRDRERFDVYMAKVNAVHEDMKQVYAEAPPDVQLGVRGPLRWDQYGYQCTVFDVDGFERGDEKASHWGAALPPAMSPEPPEHLRLSYMSAAPWQLVIAFFAYFGGELKCFHSRVVTRP
jgi:hypothetical protein